MKTRIFCLSISAVLMLAACKSTPDTAEEVASDQAETAEVETSKAAASVQQGEPASLPFEVPEHTAFLIRMEPAQFDSVFGYVNGLADGALMMGAPEAQSPGAALIVASMNKWGFNRAFPGKASEYQPAGLDPERSAMLAVSLAGNEGTLKRMRHGVPGNSQDNIPRGYFARMYLPATEPQALADWLQNNCKKLDLACSYNWNVDVGDDHVVVDYRIGDLPRMLTMLKMDPALPEVAADDDFGSDSTAALNAFLATDSAFGIYVRSSMLGDVAALSSAGGVINALEKGSPETREQSFRTGLALAGTKYGLLSPDSREIQDTAWVVRFAQNTLQIDGVAGYTKLGAKVAKAAEMRRAMSTVTSDGSMKLEGGFAFGEAYEAAVLPDYLADTSKEGLRRKTDLFRYGGSWPRLIGMHNYPVARLKKQPLMMNRYGVEGVRASFDVSAPKGRQLASLRGGFVFAISPDTNLDEAVEWANFAMKKYGGSVSSDKAGTPEAPEVHTTMGRASFGDSTAVGPPQLEGSIAQLAGILESSRSRIPLLPKILGAFGRVDVATRPLPGVLNAHMTLGKNELAPIALDAEATPVTPVGRDPECLQPLLTRSRDAVLDLGMAKADEADVRKLVGELEKAESTCPEAAPRIQYMRAEWSAWLAGKKDE